MTSSHVIAAIFVIGLLIYFFSHRMVTGTVTVDTSDVVVTASGGSVSFGTELK